MSKSVPASLAAIGRIQPGRAIAKRAVGDINASAPAGAMEQALELSTEALFEGMQAVLHCAALAVHA